MRVKVGNQWFACEPGRPIMVDLEAQDKVNIVAMEPDRDRYALFDTADNLTIADKHKWMDEGREG